MVTAETHQREAPQIDVVARKTALQKLHKAYAVTGAVCLGTAATANGTIVNEIYRRAQPDNPPAVRIGHPTGTIQVEIEIEKIDGSLELTKQPWRAPPGGSWTVMSMSVTKTLWR